jgi:uncharacterized iron-regulated protein
VKHPSAAVLLLCLLLTRCVSSESVSSQWQSPLLQTHPLVGQIWRSDDHSFIDAATLLEEIGQADYLLLGEKHDNPDHHLLRQQLLTQLLPTIALVSFEMLNHTQQARLDALVGANPENTNFREVLDWDDEGWDWDFYGPLLSMLLAEGVSVRAANISRADVMEAYAGELAQAATTVLTPEQLQVLEQEIDASHCGMLPASQFPAMVRVQQARDYQMAGSLISADTVPQDIPEGVRVLVAGNYHVRKDLGVPQYLQALSDQADKLITVAFLEAAEGMMDPQSYLESNYAAEVFDYVWFTPAAAQQDYCAAFQ